MGSFYRRLVLQATCPEFIHSHLSTLHKPQHPAEPNQCVPPSSTEWTSTSYITAINNLTIVWKKIYYGSQWMLGYQHSSKYMLLCSTEKRNSYRFETIWLSSLIRSGPLFYMWAKFDLQLVWVHTSVIQLNYTKINHLRNNIILNYPKHNNSKPNKSEHCVPFKK